MAGQCALHCIVTVLVSSHVLLCSGISQLDFITESHDVVAVPGYPLVIECEVTGERPINITWTQDGIEIVQTTLQGVNSNGTLWFEEVAGSWHDSNNTGLFQCCAQNSYGIICNLMVDVSIARLTRPEVKLTNTKPVVVNSAARLVCNVESNPMPMITWTKDNQPLPANSSRFTTIDLGGVLQINPVKASDAGLYSCSANNILEDSISPPFHLNITTLDSLPTSLPHIPLIVARPQNATITAGSAYFMECALSSTSLQVEWSRKDKKPIPPERSKIIGHSNLMLSKLRVADSGIYVCTASISEESSSTEQAEASLTVIEPPVFTVTPSDLVEKDGANARFLCQAEGTPAPEITWMHDGKVVDETTGRSSRLENNELFVRNLRALDSGIYQCIASNEAGEIMDSALLTVEVSENRPDAPRNLTAQAVQGHSILIRWVPPNQTIMAYTMHFFKATDGQEDLSLVGGQATKFTVINLHPYTNYTFYMRAYHDRSPSLVSKSVSAMTLEEVPSCGPYFSLISNTPQSAEIHWQPIPQECRNGIITKYRFCYRQTGHKKEYSCKEVKDTKSRMATFGGLRPSTTYSVAMSAATKMGFGMETSWVMIRTTDVTNCAVPLAHSMKWSVFNSSNVQLTWTDADNEQEVQPYTIDGFQLSISDEDVVVDTVYLDPTHRAHTFTHLEPGTSYNVILFAYNECGNGQEWVETITTPEPVTNKSSDSRFWRPPYDIRSTTLSSASVHLEWSPPKGNIQPDYYQIVYASVGPSEPMSVYSSCCQVDITTGLEPFTIYQFFVQGHKDNVLGQPSDAVYCRTFQDEPSAPTHVDAVPVDSHTVSVSWEPPRNPNGIIDMYIILYNKNVSQPESVWNKTERSGNTKADAVQDLNSNTEYYFRVRASTQAGPGPASRPVAARTFSVNKSVTSPKSSGLGANLEKFILAMIVVVTVIIIGCTIMVACRKRIFKRNQEEASLAASGDGSRPIYRYGNRGQATNQQLHGCVDMEMSPMLPSIGAQSSEQGNATQGRPPCNNSSNPSPYSVHGSTQQESSYSDNNYPTDYINHLGDGDSVTECHSPDHHHSIQDKPEQAGSKNTSYNKTQYLPEHQFNSGLYSPQGSDRSSPQLDMDQGGGSTLLLSQDDKLEILLPCTLPSLATTSGTGTPFSSHHSQLPPNANHIEEGGTGMWSVDDPHRPQSCESTGGDSGLVDDIDWDTHEPSPKFIQKALQVSPDTIV